MGKQTKGQRAWYERNKEAQMLAVKEKRKALYRELQALKARAGCYVCGEADGRCLDFHHSDPAQKEFAIADGVRRGLGRARLDSEIAKCVVLCSNCHRKEHAEEVL